MDSRNRRVWQCEERSGGPTNSLRGRAGAGRANFPRLESHPPLHRLRCGATKALPPPRPACFHPAVSAAKKFLRHWLPLLVWMALIFTASGDTASVRHTSLFLEPFLKFFWPDISVEAIGTVRLFVRKTAHAAEYAVLGWLWWRALAVARGPTTPPWHWGTAGVGLLLATLYAATDEYHQSFIPERNASVLDVLLDTGGAAGGLWIRWLIGRWRKHW